MEAKEESLESPKKLTKKVRKKSVYSPRKKVNKPFKNEVKKDENFPFEGKIDIEEFD